MERDKKVTARSRHEMRKLLEEREILLLRGLSVIPNFLLLFSSQGLLLLFSSPFIVKGCTKVCRGRTKAETVHTSEVQTARDHTMLSGDERGKELFCCKAQLNFRRDSTSLLEAAASQKTGERHCESLRVIRIRWTVPGSSL